MAKCKNCGAEISEENEYCESCEKEQARDKEAEFDSDNLLNLVMTDNALEKNDADADEENYFSELENLTSFPEILQADTISNEQADAKLEMAFPELMGEEYIPETNGMKDIFTGFEEMEEQIPKIKEPEDIFAGFEKELPKINEVEDMFVISGNETDTGFNEPELNGIENLFETDKQEEVQADADLLVQTKEEVPEMSEMKDLFDDMENTPNVTEKKEEKKNQNSSGFDNLFELGAIDNLDQLDAMDALFDNEDSNFSGMENLFGAETEEKDTSVNDVLPDFSGMDDLFAEEPKPVSVDMSGMEDLFAANEEPALDDIFATPVADSPSAEESNSANKDMFSLDSLLGATEELPDDFFEEMEQSVAEEPEKEKKTKKVKKQKVKEERPKEEKPKKENELYNKLFKNVPIDPSKIKEDPTPEEIAAKKKESADKKAKAKEEKKALAEAKKAEDQKKKEEKKRLAADKKEEKKARKLEEAKLVLEEMKTTRINKAGASIVFAFFIIVAVVIILGSNIASHSISIRHAEKEFERKRYNDAYEEVYGMEVKPEEQLLYDKIMTVMYVQKQLNSYNNFMVMEDNAKALDSLIKGLQRYEKYMYLADELGITADFDYVRGQLLDEIHRNFGLEEAETDQLVTLYNEGQKIGSQLEYSVAIYDAIRSEANE